MAVAGALTRITGDRTPDPDIAIHEEEEGAAAETDSPTEPEEVAVEGRLNTHEDTRRPHNGVVPTTTA